MGVQKNKQSKARSRSRRAQWRKIDSLPLVECSQCRELKVPHRMCAACGFYKKSVVGQNVNAPVADNKEVEVAEEKEVKKEKQVKEEKPAKEEAKEVEEVKGEIKEEK